MRTVSRSGHSHAESMCAWPTALRPVRAGVRGAASAAASSARTAAAVPDDVVQVERVERALQGAQDLVAARAVGGQLAHQLGEHLDVQDEMPDLLVEHGQIGARESGRAARSPAVSTSPRWDPKPAPAMSGLEAAST